MAFPRIYSDLQNSDTAGRVRLTTVGTQKDLTRQGIELQEGMVLHLYSDDANERGERDDLVFDGVAHFDEESGIWTAIVDWGAIRHASEVDSGPMGS